MAEPAEINARWPGSSEENTRVNLAHSLPADQEERRTERISIAITGQVKEDKIKERQRKVNSLVNLDGMRRLASLWRF